LQSTWVILSLSAFTKIRDVGFTPWST
jgi:hypothetical protein